MPSAPDLFQLTSTLWLWQAFEPAVKSDLFSSAVKTRNGLFLIDPIPLPAPFLEEMTTGTTVRAILVTNANHVRASADFARRLGRPILTAAEVPDELESAKREAFSADGKIAAGVTVIPIEGAAPGEVAFHFADDGGTLVLGDALINFEPYGFTFLPPKYCADQPRMRRSLRQLLDRPCERLLFAHGTPILSDARDRLETLLT
jgi:glyoxylase-like metal-dependent hydrolase (beta-lactamase superfamily II)